MSAQVIIKINLIFFGIDDLSDTLFSSSHMLCFYYFIVTIFVSFSSSSIFVRSDLDITIKSISY